MSTKEDVPKRAKSAYMFFCGERRKERTWKDLSDEEKKPYQEMAEEDKKRFTIETYKYVNSPIKEWRNWFRRITIEDDEE
jgi:hypothetical protein